MINILKKTQFVVFQVFPENVYTYKPEALSHQKIKSISMFISNGLGVLALDKINQQLWTINNSAIAKVEEIKLNYTTCVIDLCLGVVTKKTKSTILFLLDFSEGSATSSATCFSLVLFRSGRTFSYLQTVNLPMQDCINIKFLDKDMNKLFVLCITELIVMQVGFG